MNWQSKLALAGAILVFSLKAEAFQIQQLYTPAIPVLPLFYGEKVLVQDFIQGAYKLAVIDVANGSSSVVYNSLQTYLDPVAFGGTHAAWITYSKGGGGGGLGGLLKNSAVHISGARVKYQIKVLPVNISSPLDVTSDTTYKEQLSIDGGKVVWTDYRYFSAGDTTIEVYFRDMAVGSERRITNQRGYKCSPHIRGDKIVWADYRNAGSASNADIFLHDLSSGTEKAICTESHYQDQPHVYGNYVVWQDYRNTGSDPKNADIYLYDLSNNQERAICTAPGFQCYPQVYGNLIVWQDYRNATTDTSNADIYAYDLSTGSETVLTNRPDYQSEPQIYGDIIVWYDFSDNKVYKADFSVKTVKDILPLRLDKQTRSLVLSINGMGPVSKDIFTLNGRSLTGGGPAANPSSGLLIKKR